MSYQFTTQDIKNHSDKWLQIEHTPEYKNQMFQIRQRLNQIELFLVRASQVCPEGSLQELQQRLGGLDPSEIKQLLLTEFTDYEVMRSIMCLVEAILYPSQTPVKTIDRIRNWFTDANLIGVPSREGYAISTGLDKIREVFVIKTPRRPDVNLLHELTVGLYMNSMRLILPNFMFTFGGFECSPAFVSDLEVGAWCNASSNPVGYIVLERIQPSISFHDYVRTATFEQFLEKFLQILYALRAAGDRYDFTHNDLHGNNVLIRKLKDIEYIPYETEKDRREYIRADGISTIIDFGRSRLISESQILGLYKYKSIGIYTRNSNRVTDAYKLLTSLLASILKYNPSILAEAQKLIRFFNPSESLDKILERTNYGQFAPESAQNLNLDPYIRWIRTNFLTPFLVESPPPGSSIMGCPTAGGDEACDTNVYLEAGISDIRADTVFEFYDAYTSLVSQRKLEQANQLVLSVDIERILEDSLLEYETNLNELKKLLPISILSITNISPVDLFDPLLLEQYRQFLGRISKIYDLYKHLVKSRSYIIEVAKLYNRPEIIRELNKESYVEVARTLNDTFDSITTDVIYLNSVRNSVQDLIRQNPEFEWWWIKPAELTRIRSNI